MRRFLFSGQSAGDVIATLLLALALGATLVTFSIVRLSARLWETKLHGLSQDGSLYVGISHAGIRIHDVESGKEVDRIDLRGLLDSVCMLWSRDSDNYSSGEMENVPPSFHPLEISAQPNFGFEHPTKYGEVTEPYGRARIVVSSSKRYIGAVFSAGYVMLWDRHTDRFRMNGEPDYFFEQISIDEGRGELLIEGIRRVRDEVILDESSPLLREEFPRELPLPVEVLTYSLETMQRIEVKTLANAGQRIDGDRNLRFTTDETRNQFDVWQWTNFPYGSPKLLHQFSRIAPGLHEQVTEVLRCSEGICYLARMKKGEVEFIRDSQGEMKSSTLKLPTDYNDRNIRWFADGHALIRGDESNQIFTWDADRSWALYQTPFGGYHEAVVIARADGSKCLRAASEAGDIVDLPLGVKGNAIRHKLDLRVFPNLVILASVVLVAIGASWCSWATWRGSLFTGGGWLVLMLLLGWSATMWAIDCFANRIDFGFAAYLAALLLLVLTAFVASFGLLANRTKIRSGAIIALALFGMVVLMEIPGRFHYVVERPLAGQGCCLFSDDEEAQHWLQ